MNTFSVQLKNGDKVEFQTKLSIQHFVANLKEQKGVHDGENKFYPWHAITLISDVTKASA